MSYGNTLEAEDVLDIYKRTHEGEKQVRIANDYGVSQSVVSGIKSGYYWSHVTGAERTRPLTSRQQRVIQIYNAYWLQKRPVREIAEEYGMSLTAVYEIRAGRVGGRYTGHPAPRNRSK
jgi:uncharacterized protein YjcR